MPVHSVSSPLSIEGPHSRRVVFSTIAEKWLRKSILLASFSFRFNRTDQKLKVHCTRCVHWVFGRKIALFIVDFSHLYDNVLNVDVRQFRTATAKLREIALHPRLACVTGAKRRKQTKIREQEGLVPSSLLELPNPRPLPPGTNTDTDVIFKKALSMATPLINLKAITLDYSFF